MTGMRAPRCRVRVSAGLLGLVILLCASTTLSAQKPWIEKPVGKMSDEELLELLTDSPWARSVDLWQLTGRTLAELADGTIALHRASRTSPPIGYSVATLRTRPERMPAVYTVRWSSARIVIQAVDRLRELSSVVAEMQAPPPALPADHYALTVRVAKPPTPPASDRLSRAQIFKSGSPVAEVPFEARNLFFGKEDDEILDAAELRTSERRSARPVRIERHGLGAGEGFTFVFPRCLDGTPLLTPKTRWFEFRFQDKLGNTLKARFRLRDMRRQGELNL